MRVLRYLSDKFDDAKLRLDSRFLQTREIIDALELHLAYKDFICENCNKTIPKSNVYIGYSCRYCINCFQARFKEIQSIIDATIDILDFHKKVYEEKKDELQKKFVMTHV